MVAPIHKKAHIVDKVAALAKNLVRQGRQISHQTSHAGGRVRRCWPVQHVQIGVIVEKHISLSPADPIGCCELRIRLTAVFRLRGQA